MVSHAIEHRQIYSDRQQTAPLKSGTYDSPKNRYAFKINKQSFVGGRRRHLAMGTGQSDFSGLYKLMKSV